LARFAVLRNPYSFRLRLEIADYIICEDFYDDCFNKYFEQSPATVLLA
jgi:hypothetical protein